MQASSSSQGRASREVSSVADLGPKAKTLKRFSCLKLTLIVGLMMCGLSTARLFAFTHVVTQVDETTNPKGVQVYGTYALAKGEQLLNVWIVAFDASGNEVSQAQGKFGPLGRWSGEVGDFRLVTYAAEFRVSTPQGIVYSWTKIRTY